MCGTKITDSYVPQTKIGKYVLSFSYFLLSSLNIFDCKCSLNYSIHEVETYLSKKDMFLICAKPMSKCMHVAVRNAWIKHFDLNSYIFILKKSLSKLKYSCYQCFLLNGVVKLVWNHVHALPLSVNWKGLDIFYWFFEYMLL